MRRQSGGRGIEERKARDRRSAAAPSKGGMERPVNAAAQRRQPVAVAQSGDGQATGRGRAHRGRCCSRSRRVSSTQGAMPPKLRPGRQRRSAPGQRRFRPAKPCRAIKVLPCGYLRAQAAWDGQARKGGRDQAMQEGGAATANKAGDGHADPAAIVADLTPLLQGLNRDKPADAAAGKEKFRRQAELAGQPRWACAHDRWARPAATGVLAAGPHGRHREVRSGHATGGGQDGRP